MPDEGSDAARVRALQAPAMPMSSLPVMRVNQLDAEQVRVAAVAHFDLTVSAVLAGLRATAHAEFPAP